MTADKNKKINSITYNHLNLPYEIKFQNNDLIRYIYDATGTKQKKVVLKSSDRTETTYAGSFQYLQQFEGDGSLTLKFIGHPEGYIEPNGSSFNYVYQYKDHLGNIRLSYQDKDNNGAVNSSEIVQENNYYAFGLMHKGYNGGINGVDNKYKYNGKELQDELNLNVYDYGARNYDPALGRWMNVDPLAEKSRRYSPYVYALNNPVRFIDPDGMEAKIIEPGSQAEWNRQKQIVQTKLASEIATNPSSNGVLSARAQSLTTTLNNMNTMETSTQVYSLNNNIGSTGIGGTTYDPSTGNIVFAYGTDANFIHEMTHGAQYETGDIAFDGTTGNVIAQDIGDEVSAYQTQYFYDSTSVSGLLSTSGTTINSVNDITPAWVQGLDGGTLYNPGGRANTGVAPLNVNSTKNDIINAYPHNATNLNRLPNNFVLRNDYPNIKTK